MKLSHLVAALAIPCAAHAQELFPDLLNPSFRSSSDAEYSAWDIFFEAHTAPNYADVAAAASDPTLTQLNTTAFITSGFNIYSFSGPISVVVANDTSSTIGSLNNVVFQFETLGTLVDTSSILLTSGSTTYAVNNIITESRVFSSGMGGFTNRVAVQWDLTGSGVEDFQITFNSFGPHSSFAAASLDTSADAFAEVVPSARSWDGGGAGTNWSTAANWSGDSVQPSGGNVTISGTPTVHLDSDQTVGQLRITQSGAFALTSAPGSTLTVNTGITSAPGSPSNHSIDADVFLGGHGFMDVASGSELAITREISGAPVVGLFPAAGIQKTGLGTLILSGDNTFAGAVNVADGTLVLEGTNTYSATTAVSRGELVVRNDAPNGAAGALGNATSNVVVGVDPGSGPATSPAALVIDGDHEIGRNISLTTGGNQKVLAARNTTTEAEFSGNVVIGSTATNIFFRAEDAADVVRFSGAISGGSTSGQITADGDGTVIFSGATKTYANATVVSSGTLVIESGSSGNGSWTVGSGATLGVDGTLSGTGALTLQSGSTLTGSGTISKALTIGDGVTLSPGNSPGPLTTGAQTWNGGGTYLWEINDVDAGAGTDPGWDFVNISGALTLNATALDPFAIEILSLTLANTAGNVHDFNQLANYSWIIATASGGITGFDAAAFALDTSGFQNSHSGTFGIDVSGNNLVLQYTAVPEPSTWLLIAVGAVAVVVWRRQLVQRSSLPGVPARQARLPTVFAMALARAGTGSIDDIASADAKVF